MFLCKHVIGYPNSSRPTRSTKEERRCVLVCWGAYHNGHISEAFPFVKIASTREKSEVPTVRQRTALCSWDDVPPGLLWTGGLARLRRLSSGDLGLVPAHRHGPFFLSPLTGENG